MDTTTKWAINFAGDWRSILTAVRSALGPDCTKVHEALMDELHASWNADDDSEPDSDGSARMTVETTALLAQLLPALEAAVTKGHLGYSVTVVVKDGPVEVAASLPSAGWYGERSVWRSVRIDRAQIAKELFNAAQSARETLARAIRSVQP